jgi:hypothetical protein
MSQISEIFSENTYQSDCVALDTGNLFVAYEESGEGVDLGKFAIYTNELELVNSGTFYTSEIAPIYPITVTKLSNGNAVVVYGDWDTSDGKFIIYSPVGVIVKAATVFKAGFLMTLLGCCVLNNGNFVIVYDFTCIGTVYFVIYDQNGNLIKAETVITSDDNNTFIKVSTLEGGNFVITYRNWEGGDELEFAIYDQNGTLVKSPTVVDSVVYSAISVPLSTGNFMLLWGNAAGLYYAVYELDGDVVQVKTSLCSDHPVYYITATKLSDNTIPIMLSTSEDGLSVMVVDESGVITKPLESFDNDYQSLDGSSTLIDDKVGLTSVGGINGYVYILTLEEPEPPVIIAQSEDTIASKGGAVNLFVTATGTEPLEYQWYKNDVELSGKVSSNLSFYCDFADAGNYKCKVQNAIEQKDSYENNDTAFPIYLAVWYGQTFIANGNYILTSLDIKVSRIGTPGTVIVSIRTVDIDGKPTGDDLCFGTFNGNLLTENIIGEWININFGTGINLINGVKYAIVVRAPEALPMYESYLFWRALNVGDYSGGTEVNSNNSGDNWYITASDNVFKLYGITGIVYSEPIVLTVVPNNYRYMLFDLQIDINRS